MLGSNDNVGLSLIAVAIATPTTTERTTTYTGTGVDTQDVANGQMQLIFGGTNTASAVVTVEESDDNSTFTAIPTPAITIANHLMAGVTRAISATEFRVGVNFQKSKRYIRAKVVGAGYAFSGTFLGKKSYIGS